MDWSADGYILSSRKHGESSAIIEVFTREKGRHPGLVRGGSGRRMRPVLQPGNHVTVEWRARMEDHLGYYTLEAIDSRAAELMDDRLSLAALNALCVMTRELLPEREAYPALHDVFSIVVSQLDNPEVWPALYVRWEAGLLSALGYGLDLSECAATGVTDNLTHVSPRSGRAVCASSAAPYGEKMLRLPGFMRGEGTATPEDIWAGLRLTEYFLETRVQWEVNRTLPDARAAMVDRLFAEGYASRPQ
ncbi:DNA repair protein RecO [Litorimonas sp. WD9-15]|uniref:DNA repair protein RecO n=1 Tax=Litorimonas sp. WD9-15 TaxID=3418716 RepID=UPI003D004F3F